LQQSGKSRTNWKKIDALTSDEIEQAILEDPEEANLEWAFEHAELVLPEPKAHINLRVDADVLRFFKAQGKGYQTRMNAVLRSYMQSQATKQMPKHVQKQTQ